MQNVAVVGGAGHVGLPLAILLANRGFGATGIDLDEEKNRRILDGIMPFSEELGQEYLERALALRTLAMTTTYDVLCQSDVIVFVIGTPIDGNLNPDFRPLEWALETAIPHLRRGQLVVLRSTVSPGTTDHVRSIIESRTMMRVGEDIDLVFAPERVVQGRAIVEMQSLPQLVGAFDPQGYQHAVAFFSQFVTNRCFFLTPVEAELAKLFANVYRYVNFALSNEFYLHASAHGANIHRILDAACADYPRLQIPRPGPNVGGPCLYKDGWFLAETNPYADLTSTAFRINEAMPAQVVALLAGRSLRRVAILGMTFKADSDDPRNSLSYKLRKLLGRRDYDVVCCDPYLPEYSDLSKLAGVEAAILMTPHAKFRDLGRIVGTIANPDCVFIDIWGFWEEMKYAARGCAFTSRDFDQRGEIIEGIGDGERGLADASRHSPPAPARAHGAGG
jgi:UDP-N-acetyl-D-mannosaminuronic acid dehydrogenase